MFEKCHNEGMMRKLDSRVQALRNASKNLEEHALNVEKREREERKMRMEQRLHDERNAEAFIAEMRLKDEEIKARKMYVNEVNASLRAANHARLQQPKPEKQEAIMRLHQNDEWDRNFRQHAQHAIDKADEDLRKTLERCGNSLASTRFPPISKPPKYNLATKDVNTSTKDGLSHILADTELGRPHPLDTPHSGTPEKTKFMTDRKSLVDVNMFEKCHNEGMMRKLDSRVQALRNASKNLEEHALNVEKREREERKMRMEQRLHDERNAEAFIAEMRLKDEEIKARKMYVNEVNASLRAANHARLQQPKPEKQEAIMRLHQNDEWDRNFRQHAQHAIEKADEDLRKTLERCGNSLASTRFPPISKPPKYNLATKDVNTSTKDGLSHILADTGLGRPHPLDTPHSGTPEKTKFMTDRKSLVDVNMFEKCHNEGMMRKLDSRVQALRNASKNLEEHALNVEKREREERKMRMEQRLHDERNAEAFIAEMRLKDEEIKARKMYVNEVNASLRAANHARLQQPKPEKQEAIMRLHQNDEWDRNFRQHAQHAIDKADEDLRKTLERCGNSLASTRFPPISKPPKYNLATKDVNTSTKDGLSHILADTGLGRPHPLDTPHSGTPEKTKFMTDRKSLVDVNMFEKCHNEGMMRKLDSRVQALRNASKNLEEHALNVEKREREERKMRMEQRLHDERNAEAFIAEMRLKDEEIKARKMYVNEVNASLRAANHARLQQPKPEKQEAIMRLHQNDEWDRNFRQHAQHAIDKADEDLRKTLERCGNSLASTRFPPISKPPKYNLATKDVNTSTKDGLSHILADTGLGRPHPLDTPHSGTPEKTKFMTDRKSLVDVNMFEKCHNEGMMRKLDSRVQALRNASKNLEEHALNVEKREREERKMRMEQRLHDERNAEAFIAEMRLKDEEIKARKMYVNEVNASLRAANHARLQQPKPEKQEAIMRLHQNDEWDRNFRQHAQHAIDKADEDLRKTLERCGNSLASTRFPPISKPPKYNLATKDVNTSTKDGLSHILADTGLGRPHPLDTPHSGTPEKTKFMTDRKSLVDVNMFEKCHNEGMMRKLDSRVQALRNASKNLEEHALNVEKREREERKMRMEQRLHDERNAEAFIAEMRLKDEEIKARKMYVNEVNASLRAANHARLQQPKPEKQEAIMRLHQNDEWDRNFRQHAQHAIDKADEDLRKTLERCGNSLASTRFPPISKPPKYNLATKDVNTSTKDGLSHILADTGLGRPHPLDTPHSGTPEKTKFMTDRKSLVDVNMFEKCHNEGMMRKLDSRVQALRNASKNLEEHALNVEKREREERKMRMEQRLHDERNAEAFIAEMRLKDEEIKARKMYVNEVNASLRAANHARLQQPKPEKQEAIMRLHQNDEWDRNFRQHAQHAIEKADEDLRKTLERCGNSLASTRFPPISKPPKYNLATKDVNTSTKDGLSHILADTGLGRPHPLDTPHSGTPEKTKFMTDRKSLVDVNMFEKCHNEGMMRKLDSRVQALRNASKNLEEHALNVEKREREERKMRMEQRLHDERNAEAFIAEMRLKDEEIKARKMYVNEVNASLRAANHARLQQPKPEKQEAIMRLHQNDEWDRNFRQHAQHAIDKADEDLRKTLERCGNSLASTRFPPISKPPKYNLATKDVNTSTKDGLSHILADTGLGRPHPLDTPHSGTPEKTKFMTDRKSLVDVNMFEKCHNEGMMRKLDSRVQALRNASKNLEEHALNVEKREREERKMRMEQRLHDERNAEAFIAEMRLKDEEIKARKMYVNEVNASLRAANHARLQQPKPEKQEAIMRLHQNDEWDRNFRQHAQHAIDKADEDLRKTLERCGNSLASTRFPPISKPPKYNLATKDVNTSTKDGLSHILADTGLGRPHPLDTPHSGTPEKTKFMTDRKSLVDVNMFEKCHNEGMMRKLDSRVQALRNASKNLEEHALNVEKREREERKMRMEQRLHDERNAEAFIAEMRLKDEEIKARKMYVNEVNASLRAANHARLQQPKPEKQEAIMRLHQNDEWDRNFRQHAQHAIDKADEDLRKTLERCGNSLASTRFPPISKPPKYNLATKDVNTSTKDGLSHILADTGLGRPHPLDTPHSGTPGALNRGSTVRETSNVYISVGGYVLPQTLKPLPPPDQVPYDTLG
ncbi:trichohyalin-like [Chaetodon trifascialis]|uniref:trichohyalin-like n=1 Tax=Chaetodon trifascialis TaxID=109706 RepID=UPI003992A773